MPVAGLNEYQVSLMAARRRALRRSTTTIELMLSALDDAASSIMATLDITDKKASRAVTRAVLRGKLTRIQTTMEELGAEFNALIVSGVEETVRDVARTYGRATTRLAEINGRTIRASFVRIPAQVLESYARRLDTEGLKISSELWAEEQMSLVEQRIGAALARGQSAGRLAQELEQWLRDPELGAKTSIHMGPSVNYKAQRLARTEINNAYWETTALSAQESPIVEAQMWQLSGRHPRWDTCDLFAWQDGYGLGAGVYPSGRVPMKPHPNCLCYLVDVLREARDWNTPKRQYGAPQIVFDRQALPERLQREVGPTVTPDELQRLVAGRSVEERGHLTARYVDTQTATLEKLTQAAHEVRIGDSG